MKNAIKHALFQGMLFFILILISINLFTPLLLSPDVKMPSLLWILLLALFVGLIRGIRVYFYKKNVIEDERLIAIRQRVQSIWFTATILILVFTPYCGMLYAKYIQNPTLTTLGGHSFPLDQISQALLHIVGWWILIILIGCELTGKILMKRHEK